MSLVPPTETLPRETNVAAMLLAPVILFGGATGAVRDGVTGAVTVTVEVAPDVRPGQRTTLALGGDIALPEPHAAITDTLVFHYGDVPGGPQWVRVAIGPEDIPGYKAARVICDMCGEGVNFKREVVGEGRTLCRACAGERYYDPL